MKLAAVGQPRQRVVMGEVVDVLLGLLARPQVADGDDVMRPSSEIDRPQDQFDRRHRAVGLPQAVSTGWLEPPSSCAARAIRRESRSSSLRADQLGRRQAGQRRKAGVDSGRWSRRRRPQALPPTALARPRMRSASSSERRRSRMSSTTPASAKPMMAKLASATATASHPAGSADCEIADRRIGNDRHGAHRGEMMAADRERQQQRAADFPLCLRRREDRPEARCADQRRRPRSMRRPARDPTG